MRLLVIDDAPDIATLLKLAFQLDGYAVDTAPTGADALELAAINEYDVLILDLGLPDLDGLDVCRRLRAAVPPLLMIILTARADRASIIAGLDAGADDYLAKPFDYLELVARVRALLRRDMRLRSPVLRCGDLALDPAAGTLRQGDRALRVTRKQFRIMEYLMRRRGELVSQEDLLEHVWNMQANPFSNTVRTHINALRRILGDTAADPRYIETVVGMGYRLDAFEQRRANLTQILSASPYATPNQSPTDRRDAMEPQPLPYAHPGAPRLLIVDDAPSITQLLVAYFHGAGLNALAAYDGRSAIELAQRARPDAIILDLGLPDMDGLEVCRHIRRDSAVPIVMLTRRSTEQERAEGLAAGASAYMTKPFDADELQATVRELLP